MQVSRSSGRRSRGRRREVVEIVVDAGTAVGGSGPGKMVLVLVLVLVLVTVLLGAVVGVVLWAAGAVGRRIV